MVVRMRMDCKMHEYLTWLCRGGGYSIYHSNFFSIIDAFSGFTISEISGRGIYPMLLTFGGRVR